MHYPLNAFAINPAIFTIIPLNSNIKLEDDITNLSSSDVTAIRKLYNCIP